MINNVSGAGVLIDSLSLGVIANAITNICQHMLDLSGTEVN